MNFIFENWFLIIIAAVVLMVAGYSLFTFIKMPTNEQIAKVQQWLLYMVAQAEKELGHGTGQFKLRYVYDRFVVRFPAVAELISFEAFSLLVDKALQKFNNILTSSENLQKYVYPEEKRS